MDEVNKWMINKAGVLNYWYYDEEEFPFENGHLLIRGGNGSGKSVTTQSFLPLLLDGNKSPQRLDPFGTRSRKMIDYIFGESPEENEKTSYLYMEYKKSGSEEYVTTGIGLKGNLNNDQVDSWYFLLKNKRINQDIWLYNRNTANGEEVKVPLSEKELKNLFERERCGYVVATQAEYAELVNKYIFQFRTIQEFKEMVDLIVRIRAPKLSNNMGPKVLYEMLQSSLPELSTHDLRSLSDTIQNIDEIKEKLAKTEHDLKLIRSLSTKYNEYNFAFLAQLAGSLLSMQSKRDASKKKMNKVYKECEKAKRNLEMKQKELVHLDDEFEILRQKVEHLKDHDIYKMKRDLIELENKLEKVTREWDQQKGNLEEKKRRLTKLEREIKQTEDEKYKLDQEIILCVEDLDGLAEDLEYSTHLLNRDNFKMAMIQQKAIEVIQQWEVDAENFQTLMEKILRKIEDEKGTEKRLEQEREKLEKLKRKLDDISKKIEDKRSELEKVLQQLNRYILENNERNEEFVLNKDELSMLEYLISDLFETTTVKEVEKQLSKMFDAKNQELGKEELLVKNELSLVKDKVKEKHKEIKEWEKKKDPIPSFRLEETIKVRKELEKKRVPFVSFYEAVEFVPSLTEFEKERIESALIEMGILDSLIVPPEYMHMVNDSDRVLVPKPLHGVETSLKEYLLVTLPEEVLGKGLESITYDICTSISIVEHEDESYVTSFGHYEHGIVKGNAVLRESSIYIGKEARKQYREMRLKQLHSELLELEAEKSKLNNELQILKARKEILGKEFDQFVSFDEVEKINGDIDSDQRDLQSLEKTINGLHEEIANLHQANMEVKRERMKLTEGRETPSTIDAYRNVVHYTKEYLKDLRVIKQRVNDWSKRVQQLFFQEGQKKQIEESLGETQDLVWEKEKVKNQMELKIKEFEKAIAEQDADEIEQQIEESERRIQEIPGLRDELKEEVGTLKGQIPTLEMDILQEESAVCFYQEVYEWSKEIFILEVNRKLVTTYDRDVLTVDEDVLALAEAVVEDDHEGTREQVQTYRDKMVQTFNEVRVQGLEEYSLNLDDADPYLKEISDEGNEHFANELKRIKDISIRQFIQLNSDGKLISPQQLQDKIEQEIKVNQLALTKEDAKLYKEVILDNIGERIRELISQADRWKEEINDYMNQTNASNGLKLWLEWKPRKATEDGELPTSELVHLLKKDPETLKESDFKKLSKHFNSKIKYAKESYDSDDAIRDKSFDVLVKELLDYRDWFEFKIYYQKEGDKRKELTKTNYNTLSGGERAMSMYIPLLSALYSKFISASAEAPYIISMDEAFAGVDENNISTMFKLMSDFGMNYILNSQALWGTYETVDALSIAEIIRPQNTKDVTVMLYQWNGMELNTFKEEVEIKPTKEQQDLFAMIEKMGV